MRDGHDCTYQKWGLKTKLHLCNHQDTFKISINITIALYILSNGIIDLKRILVIKISSYFWASCNLNKQNMKRKPGYREEKHTHTPEILEDDTSHPKAWMIIDTALPSSYLIHQGDMAKTKWFSKNYKYHARLQEFNSLNVRAELKNSRYTRRTLTPGPDTRLPTNWAT